MTTSPYPIKFLRAGDVAVSETRAVYHTVLGSCVAICVHDPVRQIGGMIHFVLPCGLREPAHVNRYGTFAMPNLLARMASMGARPGDLVAKAFGGASVFLNGNGESAGRFNAEFARRFLEDARIPILAERLGGTRPMMVRFCTSSGQAHVKLLDDHGTGAAPAAMLSTRPSIATDLRIPSLLTRDQ